MIGWVILISIPEALRIPFKFYVNLWYFTLDSRQAASKVRTTLRVPIPLFRLKIYIQF